MSTTAKRYVITLVLGLLIVGCCGYLGAKLLGDPGDSSENAGQRGALGGILIVGSFAIVAFFAAREKGRSLMWLLAGFIAPLLPIILLLPHTPERRATLTARTGSP